MVTHTGNLGVEIASRATSATSAYLPLAGRLFGARRFSERVRLLLKGSLIDTRLLFAGGSWDPLPPAQLGRIEGVSMRVCRMIAGSFRGPAGAEPDDAVRRRLGVLPAGTALRVRRLQYAARVSRAAPRLLCLLLQDPAVPWRRALLDDLSELYVVMGDKLSGLPSPRAAPHEWEAVWAAHPTQWASLLRQYSTRLAQGAADAAVGLVPAGPPLGMPPPPVPDPADAPAAQLTCPQCPPEAPTWPSVKALASHQAARHGHRRWVRAYIADGRCPACGGDFQTRMRAMHHVQHSSVRCAVRVAGGVVPPMPLEEVARLDAADATARRMARRAGYNPLQAFVPARRGAAPAAA